MKLFFVAFLGNRFFYLFLLFFCAWMTTCFIYFSLVDLGSPTLPWSWHSSADDEAKVFGAHQCWISQTTDAMMVGKLHE